MKDYLTSSRLQPLVSSLSKYAITDAEAHLFISQRCSAYIVFFVTHSTMQEWIQEDKEPDPPQWCFGAYVGQQIYLLDFAPAFPLLPYACRNWADHQVFAELAVKALPIDSSPHINLLGNARARISWLRLVGQWWKSLEHKPPLSAAPHGRWHDDTDALYWASVLGNHQTVSALCGLTLQSNVNRVGGVHNTAIQAASYHGHENVVDLLLRIGADLGFERGYSGTAVIAAVNQSHHDVASKLTRANTNIHTLDYKSEIRGTAILRVVNTGQRQIASELLQAGAEYSDAIFVAITGVGKLVQPFIAKGVNLDIRYAVSTYPVGCKLLIVAVMDGTDETVELLISSGANAPASLEQAILEAARRGYSAKFATLMEAGARTDSISKDLLREAA